MLAVARYGAEPRYSARRPFIADIISKPLQLTIMSRLRSTRFGMTVLAWHVTARVMVRIDPKPLTQ